MRVITTRDELQDRVATLEKEVELLRSAALAFATGKVKWISEYAQEEGRYFYGVSGLVREKHGGLFFTRYECPKMDARFEVGYLEEILYGFTLNGRKLSEVPARDDITGLGAALRRATRLRHRLRSQHWERFLEKKDAERG